MNQVQIEDFTRLAKKFHRIADERDKLFVENKTLKESRDELLKVALNVWVECTLVGNPALGTLTKLVNAIEKKVE